MRGRKSEASKEESVHKFMQTLGLSYDEALELFEYDNLVESTSKDSLEYDLTPEQAQIAKRYTRATATEDGAPAKSKENCAEGRRSRKENSDKRRIINAIAEVLAATAGIDGVEITNPERTIDFMVGGESGSIALTFHKKKKKGE